MSRSDPHNRLITPSQLTLFSLSPAIGAWWEELRLQKLFKGERPAANSLDQLLFDQGRHRGPWVRGLDWTAAFRAGLPVGVCLSSDTGLSVGGDSDGWG